MNTKSRFAIVFSVVLLAGAALVAVTWAAPESMPLAGGAPAVVAYQGEVQVSGSPYSGDGYFKFAVVNSAGDSAYWSNDGSSTGGKEPTTPVKLAVSEGLFSVLLGNTTLSGMTQALTADVFSQPNRYLRVWFSTSAGGSFSNLTPDTPIAAVPYALQAQEAVNADTVDGMHASQLGVDYHNMVVVAKSGGDYTSVQAAIDSITDAAADNPYLIWVAPGVYEEQVAIKPYIHLQGAGQEATVISSASSSVWPPTQATLVLASDTSLRDLTVVNSGADDTQVALLATAGMTRTLVAYVTARAYGGGVNNYAIFLSGSGTGVRLQQVSALAENGSDNNFGLLNFSGAAASLHGGTFTGRGGSAAYGIFNLNSKTTLVAESISALAENASDRNYGMYNTGGAEVTLHGGYFTGRGGIDTRGIENANSNSKLAAEGVTALGENGSNNYGFANYNVATATLRTSAITARGGVNNYAISNELTATMKAENVTSLAENGSSNNYGLWNVNNATLVLHGASLTGRGGTNAHGIDNHGSGTTLEAESVTALAKDGSSSNYGLYNYDDAAATLRGGSFTGRGGSDTWGIYNEGSNTTLDAESVSALGESGSGSNYGLHNYYAQEARLHGGSFSARGGTTAMGICNHGSTATLEAESVNALGESGSGSNYGLHNDNYTETILRSSSFTGRGGIDAYGIYTASSGATLEAETVTAQGENASSDSYGLYNDDGASVEADRSQFSGESYGLYEVNGVVRLAVTQLKGADGGAERLAGTLTCFEVYRSFAAYSCP